MPTLDTLIGLCIKNETELTTDPFQCTRMRQFSGFRNADPAVTKMEKWALEAGADVKHAPNPFPHGSLS